MADHQLSRVAEALAGRTRRRVINALRMQPWSVAEIHRILNKPNPFKRAPVLSRPAVSQALAVLLQARLVKRRVQGRRHIYQLDHTGLDELHEYLVSGRDSSPQGSGASATHRSEWRWSNLSVPPRGFSPSRLSSTSWAIE